MWVKFYQISVNSVCYISTICHSISFKRLHSIFHSSEPLKHYQRYRFVSPYFRRSNMNVNWFLRFTLIPKSCKLSPVLFWSLLPLNPKFELKICNIKRFKLNLYWIVMGLSKICLRCIVHTKPNWPDQSMIFYKHHLSGNCTDMEYCNPLTKPSQAKPNHHCPQEHHLTGWAIL